VFLSICRLPFWLYERRIESVEVVSELVEVVYNRTYCTLLLCRNILHTKFPCQTTEHLFRRLQRTSLAVESSLILSEPAPFPNRSIDCPRNKVFVQKGESGLPCPVGKNAIIATKVTLSQSLNIQIKLFQESSKPMTAESGIMSGVATEKLIGT